MWHQVSVSCKAAETEQCEDTLLLAGAVSVSLQDSKDQPIFEPALGTTPVWEFTDVLALYEQSVDMVSVKKFLKKHLSEEIYGSLKVQSIAEKDWIRESMKDWKPLCFGEKLWICPSWQAPDVSKSAPSKPDPSNFAKKGSSKTADNYNAISSKTELKKQIMDSVAAASNEITALKDKATCILLDPGLAFGTGTHPTTRLCLEWLDANPPLNSNVIDYGCGSGILGIAALKLGANKVFAVDHDIQALYSTKMNAEKNDISEDQISIVLPKDLHIINTVDLILANILAHPLIELAATFAELVHPDGQIVLSGILHSQEAEIVQAYTPWFTDFKIEILEEWVRITAIKK